MTTENTLFETSIPDLELIHRGKVRDIYAIDEHHMLVVTSDRLSAFDVVLPDPIPGKGRILTQVADFWFKKTSSIIPNQLSDMALEDVISDQQTLQLIKDQAIIVQRLKPLPIEAIVRGYLIGSGWNDYQTNGAVCGIKLPTGLKQAEQLPQTLFTPSTKASVGDHDQNIDFEQTTKLIGPKLAEQVRDVSIAIYSMAAKYALERGIIIADTKFEFGLNHKDELILIDEVLTPDSSRFWPVEGYKPGISPPSFDKQFVRDYLETLDWNKTAPGPSLPDSIIKKTAEKYHEALQRLTR